MLKKQIFLQPINYPEQSCIFFGAIAMPPDNFINCQKIEDKINEYICSINLDIIICILQVEKNTEQQYQPENELAWFIENNYNGFNIATLRDNIILDGVELGDLLYHYALFEPLYKKQLENIYHFLKSHYTIDEYFRKKHAYDCLNNKYTYKNKEAIKKI